MIRTKILNAELRLNIENNSSHVRRKKKAIQMIEFFILSEYNFEKSSGGDFVYKLAIPYNSKKELDKTVREIIGQIHDKADSYNTFVVDCLITDSANENTFWD